MAVDSDDPIALPQAPPPRPAARRAAIEAALRKFDATEDAPQMPARKSPDWAGWRRMDRRVAGALATAALIAVVSIPLVLTTVRDNVPPSVSPSDVAPTDASGAGSTAEPRDEVDGDVPTADVANAEPKVATEPSADLKAPQTVPAPVAKSAEPSSLAEGLKASDSSSPPMAAAAPPSAPPPPPPPPPPPAPSRQIAEEAATADSVVVTGSRVARGNFASASPVTVIGSDDGFLAQLQTAFRANDRRSVIDKVALPLLVYRDGQTVTYRSAREVEIDFDRIFTPRVKQSILNQRQDTLRSRGKLRGTSRVWFGEASPNGPVRIREVTP